LPGSTMTDDSSPPVAEPDALHGDLVGCCVELVDEALGGSTYAVAKLSNLLQDHRPHLIAPLMERCARARRNHEEALGK